MTGSDQHQRPRTVAVKALAKVLAAIESDPNAIMAVVTGGETPEAATVRLIDKLTTIIIDNP